MFKISLYVSLVIIVVAGLNACSDENENRNETNLPAACLRMGTGRHDEKPVAVTLSTVSEGMQPAILASREAEVVLTGNINTRVMGRITLQPHQEHYFTTAFGDRETSASLQLLTTVK